MVTVASPQKTVMIVAAEASSCHYALRLLKSWKKTNPTLSVFGVGSIAMEKEGFECLGRAEEMAVVGFTEILSQYSLLKSVFDRLIEEVKIRKPQVVVLMDYPGFNLRLAKKLHALNVKVVYYISPQVWAWRQGRIDTIRKYCDKVLLLFPFEVPFYEKHQVPFEFVGHPLLDEIDDKYFDANQRKNHRNRCGIQDHELVLGLMPGSRKKELEYHLPQQLRVASLLLKKHPHLKLLILCAPTIEKDLILSYMEDFRHPFQLIKNDPFEMIDLVDIMLATSGTATLQVGLLEKPVVIMYRTSWISALIGRMIVKGYFGLVNLILGEEAVPERLQWQSTDKELFKLLDRWIATPETQKSVIEKLKLLKFKLGDRGASQRVVDALSRYL